MAVASSRTAPSEPGTTGTLAAIAISRARDLLPSWAMVSASGPMNSILHERQTSAKWEFSLRKPYPGWMASTSAISAAEMIDGMSR